MASLGHVVLGMAAARIDARWHPPRRSIVFAMIGFATLSLAPDLDVIAFRFGVPYTAPHGHRGSSHSLMFALMLAPVLALLLRSHHMRFWPTTALCFAVLASHGLLDMLTDGGEGVALLWPFVDERYFFPWRPLPVAPIGRGMLSARGLHVLVTELLWFLPPLAWAVWPRRPGAGAARITPR